MIRLRRSKLELLQSCSSLKIFNSFCSILEFSSGKKSENFANLLLFSVLDCSEISWRILHESSVNPRKIFRKKIFCESSAIARHCLCIRNDPKAIINYVHLQMLFESIFRFCVLSRVFSSKRSSSKPLNLHLIIYTSPHCTTEKTEF